MFECRRMMLGSRIKKNTELYQEPGISQKLVIASIFGAFARTQRFTQICQKEVLPEQTSEQGF